MCADSPRQARCCRWWVASWGIATLLVACDSPAPTPAPPAPPQVGDQAAVRRWLLCEECYHGELDSLLDSTRRDRVVPLLAAALEGPPPGRRENVRRQLEETYQELSIRVSREGRTLPQTQEEYVAHFLSNYEAGYQSRAIIGLAKIGTPEAQAALKDAADRVGTGELIYRGDVRNDLIRVTGTPPPLPGTVSWLSIAAGLLRTCGVRSDGQSYCWGRNDFGQLGDGTIDTRLVPTRITANPGFSTIMASEEGWHTCGIAGDQVHCWGSNSRGELGDGTTAHRSVPTPVIGGLPFIAVAAGGNHTCALTSNGQGYCWGGNHIGQLGDGTTSDRDVPTPMESMVLFTSVSAGVSHTCAVSEDARLFCWGESGDGQLGDGSSHPRRQPEPVAIPLQFRSVTAGAFHTCGLTRGSPSPGRAFCTGRNDNGQLGDGSTTPRGVLRKVTGGIQFSALSAGWAHTCGLESARPVIWCWGDNQFGQIGDGSVTDRRAPVRVSGTQRFVAVSAGGRNTCALTMEGKAYCWGSNSDGQIGDGTTANRSVPTLVQDP